MYCAYLVVRGIWLNRNNNIPTNKDVEKYWQKRIALKHKYNRQVQSHSNDGNPYWVAKQCADKAGVYSKEYHDELTELNEKVNDQ